MLQKMRVKPDASQQGTQCWRTRCKGLVAASHGLGALRLCPLTKAPLSILFCNRTMKPSTSTSEALFQTSWIPFLLLKMEATPDCAGSLLLSHPSPPCTFFTMSWKTDHVDYQQASCTLAASWVFWGEPISVDRNSADRNQCRIPSASFLHSPRGELTKGDRKSETGEDGGEVVIHEPPLCCVIIGEKIKMDISLSLDWRAQLLPSSLRHTVSFRALETLPLSSHPGL